MYERNETVVPGKKNERGQPTANRGGTELEQEWTPQAVSANLFAGMLENNGMKRPKRVLDFFLSIAGHALLFAAVIVLPLYFSEAIDLHGMETTYLVAPPLAPPPPAPAAVVHSIRRPKSFFSDNRLYAPHVIPKHIAKVKDLPSSPQPIAGVPGGVAGGVPGGQLGGVIGGILGDLGRVIPSPPPPKLVAHRGPYRIGSKIQQPWLIQEVQPVYPILAKAEHVQGDVVIDSVIDAKGNVTEMKLVSGHPLLVTAAFDAVRQWKYQPTLLDGTPISVEMHVTVHFRLGT